MKINQMMALAAGAACLLAGSFAVAQGMDEITVQGKRMIQVKNEDRTSSGYVVRDIALSYGVSFAGLDLAKHADVMTLQTRVKDAAAAACKEIGKQYPLSVPNDADCAKETADKAMVKVNEVVAAAAKK